MDESVDYVHKIASTIPLSFEIEDYGLKGQDMSQTGKLLHDQIEKEHGPPIHQALAQIGHKASIKGSLDLTEALTRIAFFKPFHPNKKILRRRCSLHKAFQLSIKV